MAPAPALAAPAAAIDFFADTAMETPRPAPGVAPIAAGTFGTPVVQTPGGTTQPALQVPMPMNGQVHANSNLLPCLWILAQLLSDGPYISAFAARSGCSYLRTSRPIAADGDGTNGG
jgi:hypothetical protein